MLYSTGTKQDTLSRYMRYRRIVDDNQHTYIESPNTEKIDDTNCKYHMVEVSEAGRLDIIANIYYNDPTLYWIIAIANNIIDPFIIFPGTILKIPQYSNVFEPGAPLSY